MIKTIIIKSDKQKETACNYIAALNLSQSYNLTIKPHSQTRSERQNALYWKWVTIIGGELGYHKDEMHETLKEKYLVAIFKRDDQEYFDLFVTLQGLRAEGQHAAADQLERHVIKETSTTKCNVRQMSEYMKLIDFRAADLGIYLPRPEDGII